MSNNTLKAISPIDGRYSRYSDVFSPYFSEWGLIKYRVMVEIEYFIALCEDNIPQLSDLDKAIYSTLRNIYKGLNEGDVMTIKEIEATTNHDVKAVEYFIKQKFDQIGISRYKEFIHFGLTSQDINNTAIPLSIKEAHYNVFFPYLEKIKSKIEELSILWDDVPMLAKTHGQPASPTRLGKELGVFSQRMSEQITLLEQVPFAAKFGGATGNFNAHHVAYPAINWVSFGQGFVEENLGLKHSFPTTQIEHYDHLAAYFDCLRRINTILLDLCRDVWQYVSMNYFKQKIKTGEVGSSAMPHKVNPIDFENAEGNLGVANAIFGHLSTKLPISRLQRDLTDSTVLRNVGVPICHTFIALNSIEKGLNKLEINTEAIKTDLEDNWVVVAEAIQTILRREGYPNPYEALKALTRKNEKITADHIGKFVETLVVDDEVKNELKSITPFNYTGATDNR